MSCGECGMSAMDCAIQLTMGHGACCQLCAIVNQHEEKSQSTTDDLVGK